MKRFPLCVLSAQRPALIWIQILLLFLGGFSQIHAQSGDLTVGITTDVRPPAPVAVGGRLVLTVELSKEAQIDGVTWYKGTQQVDPAKATFSERTVKVGTSTLIVGYKSELVLTNVTREDSGIYYCYALGKGGNRVQSASVQALVITTPEFELQPANQTLINSQSMTVLVDPKVGTTAAFNEPHGLAVDYRDNGFVYVADKANHMIRRISPGGSVSLFAGSVGTLTDFSILRGGTGFKYPAAHFSGDAGGPSPTVNLYSRYYGGPVSSFGSFQITPGSRFIKAPDVTVFDSDQWDPQRTAAGAVAEVKFVPPQGYQDTPSGRTNLLNALFDSPEAVAISPDGKMYIADTGNHVIRMIDLRESSPAVVTVAGLAKSPGHADGISPAPARVSTSVVLGGLIKDNLEIWSTGSRYVISGGTVQYTGEMDVTIPSPAGGSPATIVVEMQGGYLRAIKSVKSPGSGFDRNGVATVTSGYSTSAQQWIELDYSIKDPVVPAQIRYVGNISAGVVTVERRGGGYPDPSNPEPESATSVSFSDPNYPDAYYKGAGSGRQRPTGNVGIAGSVVGVEIKSAGNGGLPNSGTISIPVSNAVAGVTPVEAVLSYAARDGKLVSVSVDQPGYGYGSTPQLTGSFAGLLNLKMDWSVGSVTIPNGGGGSGYTDASRVFAAITGGTKTRLNSPRGLKIDKEGNVLIADSGNDCIRLLRPIPVDPDNLSRGVYYQLSTVAGSPVTDYSGSRSTDGVGTLARFYDPRDVAIDQTNNDRYYVYVADYSNHKIRKIELPINAAGKLDVTDLESGYNLKNRSQVSTYAGTGEQSLVDGPARSARFWFPSGLEMDPDGSGDLYITELNNHSVRKAKAIGLGQAVVSTFVGSENPSPGTANGPAQLARLSRPKGIAFDRAGNMLLAEIGSHRIRRVYQKRSPVLVDSYVGLPNVPGAWDTPVTGVSTEFYYQWFKDGQSLGSSDSVNQGFADSSKEAFTGILSQTLRIEAPPKSQGTSGYLESRNSGSYFARVSSGFRNNFDLSRDVQPAITVWVRQTDFDPVVRYLQVGEESRLLDITDEVANAVFEKTGRVLSNPVYEFRKLDGSPLDSWMIQDGTSGKLTVTPPVAYGSQTLYLPFTVSDATSSRRGILEIVVRSTDNGESARPVVIRSSGLQLVKAGENATPLSVQAQGTGITYQWKKNGVEIRGETNATLSRNSTTAADSGFYSVVVSNANGSVERSMQLVVLSSTEIASQPKPVLLSKNDNDPNSFKTLSVTPAVSALARFNAPFGLAVNRSSSEFFVSDQANNTIRKVLPGGAVSTLAGSPGPAGDLDGFGTQARLSSPSAVTVGPAGEVIFGDSTEVGGKLKRLTQIASGGGAANSKVESVIGGFKSPAGVAADGRGNLYVSDSGNHTVKVLHTSESVVGVRILQGGPVSTGGQPPQVRLSSLDANGNPVEGVGATAVAELSSTGDNVVSVRITNPGTGYKGAPVVEFYDPESGSALPGLRAEAQLSGSLATPTKKTGGAGYLTAPTVEVLGGGVRRATVTAYVDLDGHLKDFVVNDGGAGYTRAPSVLLVADRSGGSGGSGVATIDPSTGQVISVQVVNRGTGYSVAPQVNLVGGGVNVATATASMGVGGARVTNVGAGYLQAPEVRFRGNAVRPATATASIGFPNMEVAETYAISAGDGLILRSGSGYRESDFQDGQGTPPKVNIVATVVGGTLPGYTSPKFAAVIEDGAVIALRVTPGTGKGLPRDAQVTLTIADPDPNNMPFGSGLVITTEPLTLQNGGLIAAGGGTYKGRPAIYSGVGGGGVGLSLQAVMGVRGLLLKSRGSGYTDVPRVNISAPAGGGAAAHASMGIERLQVAQSGSGYLVKPVVKISGDGSPAALAEAIMGAENVQLLTGGSGYLKPPTVMVNADPDDTGFSRASITANWNGAPSNGVLSFTVTNPGKGYRQDQNPSVVVVAAPGKQPTNLPLETKVQVSQTTGAVLGVTVLNGGSGFSGDETFVISGEARVTAVMGLPVTTGSWNTSPFIISPPHSSVNNRGFATRPAPFDVLGGGINRGDVTGAKAKAQAVMGLNSMPTTSPSGATGYKQPPSVTMIGGELEPGGVHATVVPVMGIRSVEVLDGGIYQAPPSVAIGQSIGIVTGGTHAEFTASMGVRSISLEPGNNNYGYVVPPNFNDSTRGSTFQPMMGISGSNRLGNYTLMRVTQGGSYSGVPTASVAAPPASVVGAVRADSSQIVVGAGVRAVNVAPGSGGTYAQSIIQSNPPFAFGNAGRYLDYPTPPATFPGASKPNQTGTGHVPFFGVPTGRGVDTNAVVVLNGGSFTSRPTFSGSIKDLQYDTPAAVTGLTQEPTFNPLIMGILPGVFNASEQGTYENVPVVSFDQFALTNPAERTPATVSTSYSVSLVIANQGTNYTAPPTYNILFNGIVRATATGVLVSQRVTSFNITPTAPNSLDLSLFAGVKPTVVETFAGTRSGGTAMALSSTSPVQIGITQVTVTQPGYGYLTPTPRIDGNLSTVIPTPRVASFGTSLRLTIVDVDVLSSGRYLTKAAYQIPGVSGTLPARLEVRNLTMVGVYTPTNPGVAVTGSGYTAATPPAVTFVASPPAGQVGTWQPATGSAVLAVTEAAVPFSTTSTPNESIVGAGYTTPPAITFVGNVVGSGAQAVAAADCRLCLVRVDVVNPGKDYTLSNAELTQTVILANTTAGYVPAATRIKDLRVTQVTVTNPTLNRGYSVPNGEEITDSWIAFSGGVTTPTNPNPAKARPNGLGVTGFTITDAGWGYTRVPTVRLGKDSTGSGPNEINVTPVDLRIVGVRITESGEGYQDFTSIRLPVVTAGNARFGGGGSAPAFSVNTASSGLQVIRLQPLDPGSVYSKSPKSVVFGGTGVLAAFGDHATASPPYLRLVGSRVVESGRGYTQLPQVQIGEASDYSAEGSPASAFVSSMNVVGVQLDDPGRNYTVLPTVSFEAGGGSGATAEVTGLTIQSVQVLSQGRNYQRPPSGIEPIDEVAHWMYDARDAGSIVAPRGFGILSIDVTDPGDGYGQRPAVEIVSRDGSGGDAAAEVLNLTVNSVTLTNAGGGYSLPPEIKITPVPTLVGTNSDGSPQYQSFGQGAAFEVKPVPLMGLSDIQIADGGAGYVAPPRVGISGGGGSGAQAIAFISTVTQKVTGVLITNPGDGYTSRPSVTFSDGLRAGGTAARAVASVRNPVYVIGVPDERGIQDGDVDGRVRFDTPMGVTLDRSGALYVCDRGNHTIRKISNPLLSDATGRRMFQVSTLAGLASHAGIVDAVGASARFNSPEAIVSVPSGVAGWDAGVLLVSDTGNHTIRSITSDRDVRTVAGRPAQPGFADGASAQFRSPKGIDVDSLGNILVADAGNHLIRRVAATTRLVSTVAGVPQLSGSDDNANSSEYTYQWYRDGRAVSGGTSSSLSIRDADGNPGNYYVRVTNAFGSKDSDTVQVRRQSFTEILSDNLTELTSVRQGESFQLWVQASGLPSFQWYRKIGGSWEELSDGPDWTGARTSRLTLRGQALGGLGAQPGHSGEYRVRVGATLDSRVTTVQVLHRPIVGNTIRNVLSMAVGGRHNLAIHQDGTLWGWGYNSQSQLGNGATDYRMLPMQTGTTKWRRVAAGGNHSVGISAERALYSWGSNRVGQLGNNGSVVTSNTLRAVDNEKLWLEVAAGENHTLAIKADRYYGPKTATGGWGSPRSIKRDLDLTAVSATANWLSGERAPGAADGAVGDYWIDFSAGGTLWGWGANWSGQVTSDPVSQVYSPVQILLPAVTDPTDPNRVRKIADPRNGSWKKIAAAGDNSVGILGDQSLMIWGSNDFGQLGEEGVEFRSTPAMPPSLQGILFTDVSVGDGHVLAVDSIGRLWSWGNNAQGQLGRVEGGVPLQDVLITTPGIVTHSQGKNWQSVAAGSDHSLATDVDGRLWSWGGNSEGQLGQRNDQGGALGAGGLIRVPTQVTADAPDDKARWVAVAAGANRSMATTTDGMVWSWGLNDVGQVGNASSTRVILPARIGGVGTIFVDPDGKPVAFDTQSASAFLQVAFLENGFISSNRSVRWIKGDSAEILTGVDTGPDSDRPTRSRLQLPDPIQVTRYRLAVSNDQSASTVYSQPVEVQRLPTSVQAVQASVDAFVQDRVESVGSTLTLTAPDLVAYPGDPGAAYNNPRYIWSFSSQANGTYVEKGEGKTLTLFRAGLLDSGFYKVRAIVNFGQRYNGDEINIEYNSPVKKLTLVRSPAIRLGANSERLSTLSNPIYVERGNSLSFEVFTESEITAGVGWVTVPFGGTGSGLSSANPPVVVFSGGGGSGASAAATVVDGKITAVTVLTQGAGYTSAPSVSFLVGGVAVPGTKASAVLNTGAAYSWFKGTSVENGLRIPEATGPQWGVSSTEDPSRPDTVSGVYTVRATNTAGTGELQDEFGNRGAWWVVLQWAPRILTYPAQTTEVVSGGELNLSVVATASSRPNPVSYQWYFNSNPANQNPANYVLVRDSNDGLVEGAQTPNLRIRNISSSNAGRYFVRVTNSVKGVTRSADSLTDGSVYYGAVQVLDRSQFTTPVVTALRAGTNSSDLRVVSSGSSYGTVEGRSVLLRVDATGGALSYQWFRDRIPLLGQTGETLILAEPLASQAGNYSVRVSNAKGLREVRVRVNIARDSTFSAGLQKATVTIDTQNLTSFFTSPRLPATGEVMAGTRIRLFGGAAAGKSLRGWQITNTPANSQGSPTSVTVSGSSAQFVVGSGTTVVTPRVGRSFAGTYVGLLSTDKPWTETGSAAASVDPSTVRGFIRATVSSNSSVSGSVTIEGTPYTFVTTLNVDGYGSFTITARDGTRVKGAVQLDGSDGSVDGGMLCTIGLDESLLTLSLPAKTAGGALDAERKALYSLAASSNEAAFSESRYTAAIARNDTWSSLGRAGCLSIQIRGTQALVFGYLGNGTTFTFGGVGVARFPDTAGEDWNAKSQTAGASAGQLAQLSMGEGLKKETNSVTMVIYAPGESAARPITQPLVGAMVFSSQGVFGSLGLIDVRSPGTNTARPEYSHNLVRGFGFTPTDTGFNLGLAGTDGSTGSVRVSGALLASPFDSDGKKAALHSAASYPISSTRYPRGNAIDTQALVVTSFGSSFVRREPMASESLATNVSSVQGIKWLSSTGGSTSSAEAGLYSTSFTEQNADFQVPASRLGTVPPVQFSENSDTVTTRVYGVILQSDSPAGVAGGRGFLIRGSSRESLSNTLGINEVEAATSAQNSSILTFRTEASMLVPK